MTAKLFATKSIVHLQQYEEWPWLLLDVATPLRPIPSSPLTHKEGKGIIHDGICIRLFWRGF